VTEAPAAPRPDPNYILSQEEFHRSMDEVREWEAARSLALGKLVSGEADALVTTAGWVCLSFALWLFMIGVFAIRGQLRGRP
jgi:hypothetical protein